MWMLHAWYYKRKAAKFSDCLCECYMIFLKKSQVFKLFMQMLHDILKEEPSSQIVYVNVTWYSKRESRRFKFSDCLCECYMIFHKKSPLSQVLRLFMWMLQDIP
jgi:hypothetical protein